MNVQRFSDITCPKCKNLFRLTWNEATYIEGQYHPSTLRIMDRVHPSLHYVYIKCPHCNYEEEL